MRSCALFLVATFWATLLCAADPMPEREYLIKLKVCEGPAAAKPGDKAVKVLSQPQLMTLEGKACNLKIGGEILLPGFGSNAVEFADTGTSIQISCHHADDESVRLKLHVTEAKVTQNAPENFSLSQTGTLVLLKAKLNTPVKAMIHEKEKLATWVEVEVDEVTGTE